MENKLTWLISKIDSFYYNDIAFGLCDPSLGEFSISELGDYIHPVAGKKLLECDKNFVAAYRSVSMQKLHECASISRKILKYWHVQMQR